MWWRPDPDLYSYTNYFGRRRQPRSFKWRVADKTDPPPEDSQIRWYTGVVQPFEGDNVGTSFIVLYVQFLSVITPSLPPSLTHSKICFQNRYDDGDRKVHDFKRSYWKPADNRAKKMRAAKVLFKVSWTDKHGKRLSEPQELVVSVDSSACSRLIVCSARNGRIDVMDSLKSMYLDPKGLLSASWAAATSLTSSHADFLVLVVVEDC